MATGASTAVIVCQEDGALLNSSTSGCAAACWRSLALCLVAGFEVVEEEAVVGAVVVVVVVVVDGAVEVVGAWVVDETCLVLVPACCWLLVVSLADLCPKLAASLLLISATAPLSAAADLTVTCLMRPRLEAVGVDLMTLRRILCCSCWPLAKEATSRIAMQVDSLIVDLHSLVV